VLTGRCLSLWPKKVNTHLDCSEFEQAFSVLVETHGGTCKLVPGTVLQYFQNGANRTTSSTWRQSNCILWDRHCDIYREASPEEKLDLDGALMESMAHDFMHLIFTSWGKYDGLLSALQCAQPTAAVLSTSWANTITT